MPKATDEVRRQRHPERVQEVRCLRGYGQFWVQVSPDDLIIIMTDRSDRVTSLDSLVLVESLLSVERGTTTACPPRALGFCVWGGDVVVF